MCDLTQFVIIVPVPYERAATLAEYFMQHVLLKFGICHLVILDDDSPFKGVFTAMCKSLHINYDILAIRNHKGLLVETFHRFVNKDITIAAEGRAANDVFVATGVAAGYAWNSSLIDGTDILRSVPALGRELRSLLDIDLSALPPIVSNNADSVVSYLRLIDLNRYFVSVILKILVEDRRNVHAEQININRDIVTILPGDLVMARTTVQSDKANNKIAKLCYVVRGPFQIICDTDRGGYIVRKLNRPDSPEFKFMSEDLYILPPSLKSCEPVDGSYTRYLNQFHASIVNLLKKSLNIELYKEKWFGTPPQHSLHNSNTITLHYPFLQLLQHPSLVSPTFITKQILLLHYHFSNK